MPAIKQISWRSMAQAHPAAHVVIGKVYEQDATNIQARLRLLSHLAGALCDDVYALAVVGDLVGDQIHCALASSTDAAKLAKAVGADDMDARAGGRRRFFRFDDDAAATIGAMMGQAAC
jgi:hypothetical protein